MLLHPLPSLGASMSPLTTQGSDIGLVMSEQARTEADSADSGGVSEGDVVRLLRERGPLVSSALSAAFRAQARTPAPSLWGNVWGEEGRAARGAALRPGPPALDIALAVSRSHLRRCKSCALGEVLEKGLHVKCCG